MTDPDDAAADGGDDAATDSESDTATDSEGDAATDPEDDAGETATSGRNEPPEWAKERARAIASGEDPSSDADEDGADERVPDVPADVVDEAERLTRLAREASDPAAADRYRERREAVVGDHGYTPRVRDEDDTLVLYPDEWMASGTVRMDRVDDTDRAVEVSLSGAGDQGRYSEVAAYNDTVVEAVAERADEVHAETARSFADFMSNHYVRPIGEATPEMRAEFREEYFPRNGWPTAEQLAVLDESLSRIASIAAEVDGPES